MNRRGFFAALVGAGTAPLLPASVAFRELYKPGWHQYGKWRIMWTGWKESQSCPWLAGQWLALDKDISKAKLMYYASTPGREGRLSKAESIFMDLLPGQTLVDPLTPEDVKEAECRRTLSRLLRILKEVG